MAFNVTVTPQVQEVEVSATVQPYEVQVEVIDSPILDLTTIGTSGDATFDPFTGVLNIPNYTTDLSGVVPNSRTLTINGTAFDLSANRSWTVGDLLSSGSYANPSWITSLGWNKISSTPTTLAGYGITDAYTTGQVDTLLSAKQNTLSLTTTGSSGASTLVGATLNIPNYTLSGLGGIDLNSLLTGFSVGANTSILTTDSILQAFNKTQGQINARVSGSGTSGQVAFWNGASSQTGDAGFTWDNTNKFIQLQQSSLLKSSLATDGLYFSRSTNGDFTGVISVSASFNSRQTITITNREGVRIDYNSGPRIQVFSAGTSIGIASTGNASHSPTAVLDVNGTGRIRNGVSLADTSGNVQIGTTTDAGFRLDVNGTARVQGALTVTGSTTASGAIARGANYTPTLVASANNDVLVGLDVNPTFTNGAFTGVTNWAARIQGRQLVTYSDNNYGQGFYIQNTNTGTSAITGMLLRTSAGTDVAAFSYYPSNYIEVSQRNTAVFASVSTQKLGFQACASGGANAAQDIWFSNKGGQFNATLFSTGNLLIQNAGTHTDSGFRLDVNGTARVQGDFTISDTKNIILSTTTGTKIGTATSQKLSLWNATPDVQPTTAIVASAFVANLSGILDDTATFGGYTIGQIVAALKRLGALA